MHLLKCYSSFTTVGSYISIEIYNYITSDLNNFEIFQDKLCSFHCSFNFKPELKKKLNKFNFDFKFLKQLILFLVFLIYLG